MLPVFIETNKGGLVTRGTRDYDEYDDDNYYFPLVDVDHEASAGAKPTTKRNATLNPPSKPQLIRTHNDLSTPAGRDHVDLTRYDEESSNHLLITKHLATARQDYSGAQPPFVRLNRGRPLLGSQRVTLASADGRYPQKAVPAMLVTRAWDTKSSYYTIDCNGERIIVKPVGGRYNQSTRVGTQYRAWSGQGSVYEKDPVAFDLKDDAEDPNSDGKVADNNMGSGLDNVSIHDGSNSAKDREYLPTSSGMSSVQNQAQQRSHTQGKTAKSDPPKLPVTRGWPTDLKRRTDDGATRGLEETTRERLESTSQFMSPPPNASAAESSTGSNKILEINPGKRLACDIPDDDRSSKKVRPENADILASNVVARIPPTLTTYKQERTILFILLPGSTADMTLIKLRSAMSLSTQFSSVCTAARIEESENVGITVMLQREEGGPDRGLVLRRTSLEAFEFFLETVDKAPCWKEESGSLSFVLQLTFAVEMGVRI